MIHFFTGGSASGKSKQAESFAVDLAKRIEDAKLIYLATMYASDEESLLRIERHRQMRAGKGFCTIEKSMKLSDILPQIDHDQVILLEDVSNLLANEMYLPGGDHKKIVTDIIRLSERAHELIVVSNEIFTEDIEKYDADTREYIYRLASINKELCQIADNAFEVVCGITVNMRNNK